MTKKTKKGTRKTAQKRNQKSTKSKTGKITPARIAPISPIQPKQPEFIEVRSRNEDIVGKYANLAIINHTRREFIIDFISRFTGPGILSSRIITSPQHAKALLNALQDNIKKFEKKFGEIKVEK